MREALDFRKTFERGGGGAALARKRGGRHASRTKRNERIFLMEESTAKNTGVEVFQRGV